MTSRDPDKPPGLLFDHVVFDLDGTLTDTWPPALRAFRAAIEEFADRPFSDEDLRSLAGPAEEGILQALFPENWEVCFQRYLDGFGEEIRRHDILFPGTAELLETLDRRGAVMAVVSGKSLAAVEMALAEAGLARFFRDVRGGSAAGDVKADELRAFVVSRSLCPERVAYVGDSAADITAGRAAGVAAIGAAWAPEADAGRLSAAGADQVFQSIGALGAWLTS